jgi:hypothetical protein
MKPSAIKIIEKIVRIRPTGRIIFNEEIYPAPVDNEAVISEDKITSGKARRGVVINERPA